VKTHGNADYVKEDFAVTIIKERELIGSRAKLWGTRRDLNVKFW
jgi:hypothetical protein